MCWGHHAAQLGAVLGLPCFDTQDEGVSSCWCHGENSFSDAVRAAFWQCQVQGGDVQVVKCELGPLPTGPRWRSRGRFATMGWVPSPGSTSWEHPALGPPNDAHSPTTCPGQALGLPKSGSGQGRGSRGLCSPRAQLQLGDRHVLESANSGFARRGPAGCHGRKEPGDGSVPAPRGWGQAEKPHVA